MAIRDGGIHTHSKGDAALAMDDLFLGKPGNKHDVVDDLLEKQDSLKRDVMQLRGQVEFLQQFIGAASSLAASGMENVDPGGNRNICKPQYGSDTKGLMEYFTSNPTAQNIRIESRASVVYPGITVCPGVSLNYTALNLHNVDSLSYYTWWELEGFLNMSSLEALNFLTMKDFSNIVESCHIFPPPSGILKCGAGNDWTWINGSRIYETEDFENNTKAYYEIHIDSVEEPFTEVRNVSSSGQTFSLTKGSNYILSLSVKDYAFLPSGSKCNGDENYDYQKCLEMALTEKLLKDAPCVKPSVLPSQHDHADKKSQCNTTQDEEDLIYFYRNVQDSDPGCLRKCKRTTYNLIPIQDVADDLESGVIQLSIPTAELEIVEEQALTSVPQFLSDIGGMVGLYLGFSLLSLYEFLETLILWLKSRFFTLLRFSFNLFNGLVSMMVSESKKCWEEESTLKQEVQECVGTVIEQIVVTVVQKTSNQQRLKDTKEFVARTFSDRETGTRIVPPCSKAIKSSLVSFLYEYGKDNRVPMCIVYSRGIKQLVKTRFSGGLYEKFQKVDEGDHEIIIIDRHRVASSSKCAI
ncbi:unnamed protein product [Darwinula stevensoni]|uniref:Uncharacterized protein n=1 Tax=Darwinula stevensoni TaxID=69355 RepID=A0A7R8XF28_9CRUS|nr:unnamed protein product [Darwinula stevensoni]CAG0894583.1 unnamed protein product [Darwinula stevensoni]